MEDNSINSQNKLTEQERWFYNRLDELQKRMYLGEKAIALGRSGCRIIAERYGVNIKTVRQGKKDFLNPDLDAPVHIRKKGGGAKKTRKGS